MSESTHAGAPSPLLAFTHQVANLRLLIDSVRPPDSSGAADSSGGDGRPAGSAPVDDEALQHLETAYEELRVAEEEVRVQQEQITGLVADRRQVRSEHERLLAALPVAVVVTNLDGTVRAVNAASAQLLGARVSSLTGKPITSFFDTAGRGEVRRRLTGLRGGEQRAQFEAVLARSGDTTRLHVARTVGDESGLTWMLLDRPVAPQSDDEDVLSSALPPALVALAAVPARVDTVQELLSEAAAACRTALGDDVEVSITTGSPLEPAATSTTSQLAQVMDGAQLVARQGPCILAFEEAVVVWTSTVAEDPRWEGLHAHLPAEIHGVVAVPLGLGEAPVGVLNVYRRNAAMPAAVRESAALLGATIGAILTELGVRTELRALAEQMEQALASRAVIDQAKGIIMGDKGWDADRAFAHLVSLSSANGVKVRDLAQALVEQLGDHGASS